MLDSLATLLHDTSRLHTLLNNLYAQPHITSTPGGTHGTIKLTQQEKYLHTREHIAECWQILEQRATGWKIARGDQNVTGDAAVYLAAHLEWAYSMFENLAELEHDATNIHAIYERLAGEADDVSSYLCPMCGKAQLRYRDTDNMYWCPACEGAWTPTQLQALRYYRILNAGQWISINQASQQYGIPAKTIYKWIERGKLERQNKRVNTAQLEQLC